MQIKNAEHSIRSTMVAVFKKQGLSDEQATAKAAKNLDAAIVAFDAARARFAEQPVTAGPKEIDRVTARAVERKLSGRAAAARLDRKPRPAPSIKTKSRKVTLTEQPALHRV